MGRKKRRIIVVDYTCKRGHKPFRIREKNGSLVCLQCTKMRSRYDRMLDRCYNPKSPNYQYYGGRGIGVCDRWRYSFVNWYNDIGYLLDGKPGLTLERKNNDRGYSPRNCRVATTKEQNRNQRRSVKITYEGVTKNQQDWADELGVHSSPMSSRRRYRPEDVEYVLFDVLVTKNERGPVMIEYKSKRMNLKDWCKALKCSLRTVEDRVYVSGWTYAQALGFAPKNGKFRTPNKIK